MHVYRHLGLWTHQCSLCSMLCRLETNFEKHLRTHGLTRRAGLAGFTLYTGQEADLGGRGVARGAEVGDREVAMEAGGIREEGLVLELSKKEVNDKSDEVEEEAVEVVEEEEEQEVAEGTVQPNYHLMKKAVFMDEVKSITPFHPNTIHQYTLALESRNCLRTTLDSMETACNLVLYYIPAD